MTSLTFLNTTIFNQSKRLYLLEHKVDTHNIFLSSLIIWVYIYFFTCNVTIIATKILYMTKKEPKTYITQDPLLHRKSEDPLLHKKCKDPILHRKNQDMLFFLLLLLIVNQLITLLLLNKRLMLSSSLLCL